MYRLLIIIIPIITILVLIFVSIFTPVGSNLTLKPIVNTLLNKEIKKPKIEITKLNSKFGFIDVDAKSDNGIKANTKGDINYFDKKFNLNYKANAQTVTVDDRDIKLDLDIKGQAVGSFNNFGVNGEGRAFDSDINYKFIIKNKNPQSIDIDLNSAQIAKIFALLNQQPLLDGYLFINAKMPSLDIKNPRGKALIEIKNGQFSQALIKRFYKIKIPKDEKLRANIKAVVAKKYIISKGDINTTTAKINIKKLTSSLDFTKSKGYYGLNIDNLSRLNSLTNLKLKGKLSTSGVFYLDRTRDIFQLNTQTRDFGGVTKISYLNGKVSASLKGVDIVKVLQTLSMPYYLSYGKVNAILNLANLKNLNGNFAINTSGVLNKKLLKVKLPSYKYHLKAKGLIKDNKLSIKRAKLLTNFINLDVSNLSYSILTGALKTTFLADINNLRALQLFTQIPLNGELKVAGDLQKVGNIIKLDASTKSLGGNLKFKYDGNTLKADFSNISVAKLLFMLNQPHFVTKGSASGKVDITSIKNLDGIFTIKSLGSLDSATLQKLYNINLGSNFKYSMLVKNGIIKSGRFITQPKLNTSLGSIVFEYLNYDTKQKKLTSKYSVNIDNLRKLEPLIGQKLNGSFAFKGTTKVTNNQLLTTAIANELGGVINLIADDNRVKIDAAGVSVISLLNMLNLEQVLDGVAKFNLTYNQKAKRGKFIVTLDEARFLNSSLVQTLKNSVNFDLSKEIFQRAKIDGNIDKNIITFNLSTQSQRVQISTKSAKIDTKHKTINAKIVIYYKNQDYRFKLTGNIENPHIQPILEGYVKRKVIKKVKDLGIDKEIKKVIPNEIKALEENNITKDKIKKLIPNEIKGLFNNL